MRGARDPANASNVDGCKFKLFGLNRAGINCHGSSDIYQIPQQRHDAAIHRGLGVDHGVDQGTPKKPIATTGIFVAIGLGFLFLILAVVSLIVFYRRRTRRRFREKVEAAVAKATTENAAKDAKDAKDSPVEKAELDGNTSRHVVELPASQIHELPNSPDKDTDELEASYPPHELDGRWNPNRCFTNTKNHATFGTKRRPDFKRSRCRIKGNSPQEKFLPNPGQVKTQNDAAASSPKILG
jgi:hypothetical protein